MCNTWQQTALKKRRMLDVWTVGAEGGKNNREGIYNFRELNSSHLFGLFFFIAVHLVLPY